MSLIASRSAALLAPLPEQLQLTAITDTSLALLAPVEAEGVAARTRSGTASGEAAQPFAHGKDTKKPAPAFAVSAADAATQSVATTPATPAKTSFAGTTATVAQIGKPAAMPQPPAAAGSIGSAVLALVMVIGLILALAWLAKRMPGLRGGSASSALRVIGSLALSPRERLVVVAVGDTQLVLGVGAGGTRTLHTLSEPLPVTETAGTPAFAQLLSQHFGKKA
ncbi:flagellar biosynthetic protein FliO [Lysobacter sp. Root494]|uniref:flagellar biosynthetic protein FliO n=1 Tax=Lysobacter sp. Root494 TaxID=1736549 RepID=UPI000A866FFE|nr:flagellar biosynthetic protein FliO [Lysobacter sp. Root494]